MGCFDNNFDGRCRLGLWMRALLHLLFSSSNSLRIFLDFYFNLANAKFKIVILFFFSREQRSEVAVFVLKVNTPQGSR